MKKDFTSAVLSRGKPSQTDWPRVLKMKDEEIDKSDSPEITPEMFARAVVKRGLKPKPPKELVSLRLDQDVIEWYRGKGKGYQTEINALLRAFMEIQKGEG